MYFSKFLAFIAVSTATPVITAEELPTVQPKEYSVKLVSNKGEIPDFEVDLNHRGDFEIEKAPAGVKSVLDSSGYTREEIAPFWRKYAAKKFVKVTLAKNTLTDEERNTLMKSVAEYLFDCGVRRVSIHQAYGHLGGMTPLFDEERSAAK